MQMNTALYQQISRFYEAQLSRQEERELLQQLLKFEGKDPAIDEALAVMLASRLPIGPKANRNKHVRLIAGIAASAAAVLAVGILFHHRAPQNNGKMYAYVGGVKIENHHEIMKIIDTQLNDIGESSDLFSKTLSTDLDDIREALTADDI